MTKPFRPTSRTPTRRPRCRGRRRCGRPRRSSSSGAGQASTSRRRDKCLAGALRPPALSSEDLSPRPFRPSRATASTLIQRFPDRRAREEGRHRHDGARTAATRRPRWRRGPPSGRTLRRPSRRPRTPRLPSARGLGLGHLRGEGPSRNAWPGPVVRAMSSVPATSVRRGDGAAERTEQQGRGTNDHDHDQRAAALGGGARRGVPSAARQTSATWRTRAAARGAAAAPRPRRATERRGEQSVGHRAGLVAARGPAALRGDRWCRRRRRRAGTRPGRPGRACRASSVTEHPRRRPRRTGTRSTRSTSSPVSLCSARSARAASANQQLPTSARRSLNPLLLAAPVRLVGVAVGTAPSGRSGQGVPACRRAWRARRAGRAERQRDVLGSR